LRALIAWVRALIAVARATRSERIISTVAHARQRAHAFADRYDHRYPAAVASLPETLPELTTLSAVPREHWAQDPPYQSGRGDLRRDPPPGQGDRPAAWCGRCWTAPRAAGTGS
jgi:hypothetical protein